MKLGQNDQEIGVPLGTKDACHVPGVYVTSRHNLMGSDFVRFTSPTEVVQAAPNNYDGIVDPFRTNHIPPGNPVWVMLKPGVVQNLVHDFNVNLPVFNEAIEANTNVVNETQLRRELEREIRREVEDRVRSELEDEYNDDGCRGCY